MGSMLSRNQNGVEELDTSSNASYIFPPTTGSYFASYFYMGGKKFDSAQPECYLFGENSDLNFLGPKPNNFTYQIPSSTEPIRALKCLVNIRKDSLRLIKVPSLHSKSNKNSVINNEEREAVSEDPISNLYYNIEFTFDADCPCFVNIFYHAQEDMVDKALVFTSKSPNDCSKTMRFNAGCNQQFCLPAHKVLPSSLAVDINPAEWSHKNIPIAIQVTADCGPKFIGHSHVTYAMFEKLSDQSWTIKLVKQKQIINGVSYLLQEIYGIENKVQKSTTDGASTDENAGDDVYDEDNNSECVVCLSDTRDTLILPCKHLCLCSDCANQLRFQQSGCPICRQPFRALLQIRAVRKKVDDTQQSSIGNDGDGILQVGNQSSNEDDADEQSMINVKIPDGYEVVPLITGINETYQDCSFELGTGGPSVTHSLSNESLSKQKVARKSLISTTVAVEDEVVHKVGKSILSGKVNPIALQSEEDPDNLDAPTGHAVDVNSIDLEDLFDESEHELTNTIEEINIPLKSKEVETGEANHSAVEASVNQVVLVETCDEQTNNDDVAVEVITHTST